MFPYKWLSPILVTKYEKIILSSGILFNGWFILFVVEKSTMSKGGGDNPWEHTGLLEGDIMVYMNDGESSKNGLTDEMNRWPNATVPFYIDESFGELLFYLL